MPNPTQLMPGWWRRFAGLGLVHLSFSTWLMLALQTVFMVLVHQRYESIRAMPAWEKAATVLLNWLTIIAWFQMVGLALLNRPRWLRLANLLSVLAMMILQAFHFYQGAPVDYEYFRENLSTMLYPQALSTIFGNVAPAHWLLAAPVLLVLAAAALATPWMARWPAPAHRRRTLLATLAVLLGAVAVANDACDVGYFLRSACGFAADRGTRLFIRQQMEFPYVKPASNDIPPDRQNPERPHVFLILMESFNARFAEARDPLGREYTPFFNSLIGQGLYVEKFYAPSPQTPRGQLATLASILPSYRGKVSYHHTGLRLRGLPAILRDRGYATLFFQGFPDLDFDNTDHFMAKLGFDVRKAMNEEFVTEADKPCVWGWGLQDDLMYRKFFGYLDGVESRARAAGRDPRYFAALATVSHHMGFWDTPPDQRYMYPNPTDHHQHYANSIRVADEYLQEFFRQLDARGYLANHIVLIQGDHSFPAGEHGRFANDTDYYEENFRTPLLILWPGRLAPQRVRDVPYSQLDIAPTLLDLMRIRQANHFIGRSILPGDSAPLAPIHLIQPYHHKYLCAVLWPMKYVQSLNGRLEFLYDLAADPREQHNLIERHKNSPLVERLRSQTDLIRQNQRLIENNCIWPPQTP